MPFSSLWWILLTLGRTFMVFYSEYADKEIAEVVPDTWNKYPWLAAILNVEKDGSPNESNVKCGGVLINERFVLTSGFFIRTSIANELLVRVGIQDVGNSNKGTFSDFKIEYIVIHPLWAFDSVIIHDLALLKLTTAVRFTNNIRPISLPTEGYADARSPETIVAVGWGRFEDDNVTSLIPREANLSIVSNSECANFYESMEIPISHNQLCATASSEGNVTFSFRSGSAFIQKSGDSWVLISIVSWRLPLAIAYHVTTPVLSYLDWIKKHSNPNCTPVVEPLNLRIVSGVPVSKNEFPFLAAIFLIGDKGEMFGNHVWCGGALINDRFVLTAAHCVERFSPGRLMVRLGERDITTDDDTEHDDFKVDFYVIHPSYGAADVLHDLALVKLATKVHFKENIEPVILPTEVFAAVKLDDELVTAIGWGRTEFRGNRSSVPLKVKVPVVSNDACSDFYGTTKVFPTNLCIGVVGGGKGTCAGDSGGPIVYKYKNSRTLVSVVSWGKNCTAMGGFSISTRVVPYLDWIHDHSVICAEYG